MITVCSVYIKSISDQLLIASTSVIKLPPCVDCCDSVVGQRREENEILIRDLRWTLTHTHTSTWAKVISKLPGGGRRRNTGTEVEENKSKWPPPLKIDRLDETERNSDRVCIDWPTQQKIEDQWWLFFLGSCVFSPLHHWLGRHCLLKRDRS